MNFDAFFVIVFVAVAALSIWSAVVIVPEGYKYMVTRFGRYSRTLEPGLNLILPLIETIGERVDIREKTLDVPPQEVITKDNAPIKVDAIAYYQINNPFEATYQVADLEEAVHNLIITNIRTVIGTMDLEDAFSKRDKINHDVLENIESATRPWGVRVTRVEIQDLTPPKDIADAMALQAKAVREARAKVSEAKGRKDAVVLDAEARERMAEAEAKATKLVSQEIASGGIQAINYFIAEKYVDALKQLASANNQKVLMMPLDASSVIGAIAGISDIAREAFSGVPPAATPAQPDSAKTTSDAHDATPAADEQSAKEAKNGDIDSGNGEASGTGDTEQGGAGHNGAA